MKLVVVGGMNLDLLAFPNGVLVPRDSNPGRIVMRPGGVGRNIAARLAAMGQQVSLLTALGKDDSARLLSAACAQAGIDLSLSLQTDRPSPCYLCIHDHQGDMAAAVSDMTATDCLTPKAIAPHLPALNAGDGCVLDANLPKETLEYIARNATVPLALDPVSCAKAPRVRSILPYLTLLKPNRMEAAALTGETAPSQAAEKLLAAGVKNVFISLGSEGVYYAGSGGERGLIPALPLPTLPLTGAGDALCAGLTLGMLSGGGPKEWAIRGVRAAYDALMAAL